jgi:CxxC-x17-CxxC domain-containing protein
MPKRVGKTKGNLKKEDLDMAFEDKTLVCKDCGQEFLFSASEQEFYAEKGFQNEPVRCRGCRTIRKQQRNESRELFTVICADCGNETQVPFKPVNDRPVYCRACYDNRR